MANQSDFIGDYNFSSFGGFNPAMNEFVRRQIQAANRNTMTNRILMEDPRAQLATTMLAGQMGFNPNSLTARMTMSAMINSRMAAGITGGSRLDFFSGINTGFANAGRIRGSNVQSFYGPGTAMNTFSYDLMKSTEAHFFNKMGGAYQHRTHGLNRSELGRLASEFGASGMLSGWGEFERGKNGVVGASQNTKDKMNRILETGAEVIGSLKDILGGASMDQLMSAMNSLAGGQIMSETKLSTVKQRLAKIRNYAQIGGGSAEAWLLTHAQQAAAFRAVGFTGAAASNMGDITTGRLAASRMSLQAAQANMSSMGFDVPDLLPKLAAEQNKNASMLLTENPDVASMLYAVNFASGLTEGQRESLKNTISSELSAASSPADIQRTINRLRGKVFGVTKGSARAWFEAAGGDPMAGLSEDDISRMTEISMRASEKRAEREMSRALASVGTDQASVARMLKARRDVNFETISKAATGDTEAMRRSGLSQSEAKALSGVMMSNANYMNSRNFEDVQLENQALANQIKEESQFGAGRQGRRGLLTDLVNEVLGDTINTDLAARELLRSQEGLGREITQQEALDIKRKGGFVDLVTENGKAKFYTYTDKQVEAAKTQLDKAIMLAQAEKLGINVGELKGKSEDEQQAWLAEQVGNQISAYKKKGGFTEERLKYMEAFAERSPAAREVLIRELGNKEEYLLSQINNKNVGTDAKEDSKKELELVRNTREKLMSSEETSVQSILTSIFTLLKNIESKVPLR